MEKKNRKKKTSPNKLWMGWGGVEMRENRKKRKKKKKKKKKKKPVNFYGF
jgi:hypothetical protein